MDVARERMCQREAARRSFRHVHGAVAAVPYEEVGGRDEQHLWLFGHWWLRRTASLLHEVAEACHDEWERIDDGQRRNAKWTR